MTQYDAKKEGYKKGVQDVGGGGGPDVVHVGKSDMVLDFCFSVIRRPRDNPRVLTSANSRLVTFWKFLS